MWQYERSCVFCSCGFKISFGIRNPGFGGKSEWGRLRRSRAALMTTCCLTILNASSLSLILKGGMQGSFLMEKTMFMFMWTYKESVVKAVWENKTVKCECCFLSHCTLWLCCAVVIQKSSAKRKSVSIFFVRYCNLPPLGVSSTTAMLYLTCP